MKELKKRIEVQNTESDGGSAKTSVFKRSGAGFTLIEITMVIALAVLVFGFSAALGFDAFGRNYLRTEQTAVISAIQKARSQAMNNVNNEKHGFYFDGTNYVIFEGTSSSWREESRDLIISRNPSISATGTLTEVVFDRLSGNANPEGYIILSDGVSSITISASSSGRINW